MDIIHIVLGKANPDRMNGVNKVVHQLATKQAASNRNVEVWGITEDLTHNYAQRNFKTQLFKKSKNPFAISKDLKKAIKHSKNATFHLHGGWVPTFWAVAKSLKKYDKKSVLTPHGAYNTIAMKAGGLKKKFYFQLFEKTVLKTVNKVHCIGASEKEGLETIYKNDKQIILPYGFNFPKIAYTDKAKSSSFVIGFVGRIDIHTKGLDLLTEAFAKFKQGKNTKLWIVGDGTEMPNLKSRVDALDITKDTTLFGSKFGVDKNNLIQQMDVFTHPSRNEGLPTAVLEAASFGVPSIVTEATNVGRYLSMYKAGFATANEDVDALTNALEKVYNEWQNNAIDHYKERTQIMLDQEFNWDKLVYKYDELYA